MFRQGIKKVIHTKLIVHADFSFPKCEAMLMEFDN